MANTETISNGSISQPSDPGFNNNNNSPSKPGLSTVTDDQAASGPKPITDPKLLSLAERTGYPLVQENGQRLYGPPPNWEDQLPPRGCEVFVGKIPRDCMEDELVPVFEKVGRIYEVRLMMDFNGSNRGYGFVTYTTKADAKRAVRELNDYEIRHKKYLGVCLSVDNCRLFVGGIPRDKKSPEILEEMKKIAEGVVNAIVYPSIADKTRNRGFAFVEFESHRAAAMARRKLLPGRAQMFGQPIAVDWAEPESEMDEDIMSKVRILYVRNLMLSTTEETLERIFSEAAGVTPGGGAVERVKKLKDYAFVHFRDRDDALKALAEMNGKEIEGSKVEVVLAKPVDRESQSNRNHSQYNKLQPQIPGYAGGYTSGYPGLIPIPMTGPYMSGVAVYNHPIMNGGGLSNQPPPSAYNNGSRITSNQIRDQSTSGRGHFSRGRSAAGSRAAGGGAKNYSTRNNAGYRPFTQGDGLYDIQPGMELIPAHNHSIKSHNRSPVQILEEVCLKNGWGVPSYHLYQAVGPGPLGGASQQQLVFKVHIPGLSQNHFMSNKLSRSDDEAKRIAADNVLQQIGIYAYPSYPNSSSAATAGNPSMGQSYPYGSA